MRRHSSIERTLFGGVRKEGFHCTNCPTDNVVLMVITYYDFLNYIFIMP